MTKRKNDKNNKYKKKAVVPVVPKAPKKTKKERKIEKLKRREVRLKQEQKMERKNQLKSQLQQEQDGSDIEYDDEGDDESFDEDMDGSGQEEEEEEKQDVYEGSYNKKGQKEGHGVLTMADGCKYEGIWKRNQLVGRCKVTIDDTRIEGTSVDWEMHGECREYSVMTGEVTFEGQYKNGERNGPGIIYLVDGGKIHGIWKSSQMDGQCTYYYPDHRFSIKGKWKDGDFVSGRAIAPKGVPPIDDDVVEIKRDEATDTLISSDPLQADPYEQHYVFVAPSTIPNSNEGLFAKRDIPANRLVSFYNGLRIDPKIADERDWSFNSNTMFLDKETYIDIPPSHSLTTQYCASLGHKANHSFQHNTVYKTCYHPRFGDIKCVTSIKPIAKGEEILVHYDYEEKDKPAWYKAIEEVHQQQQNKQQ
ncbi:histone-lysine N-methyltransferase [Cavenderia fasciculata]|uniref:Histone-lysine N-methyltransferase SETD7 n=1 Tax=Cavenderia fasciculata TaxID=261658 RepID=F4QDD1_CACFS|nr:histone-lysine N-methyltransferase [Cavenderia fasciculata]EGG13759.1 histone-lysine N-methyltransferase [Cavenderia fasciculata]|eukprot:XP_004350467.1 histone-lysine N-methyltransferase [Cavenderia fasciculata]